MVYWARRRCDMVRVQCVNSECNKLFAELKTGNIYTAASTDMHNVDDSIVYEAVQIEILCHRCKRKTVLIIQTRQTEEENNVYESNETT